MADRVNLEPDHSVDSPGSHAIRARLSPWPRLWLPWRPRCLGCGEPGTGGRDLCAACDAALPRIRYACSTCGLPLRSVHLPAIARHKVPNLRCTMCRQAAPPLTHVVAPFLYAAPFDRWLPRFKFHHDFAVGRLLSQLMLDACTAAPGSGGLVPVPLHPTRLRSRGYNQALELARPLARALALPLRTDLLARVRATSAQSSLHAADRHGNLCDAFAVSAGARHPFPVHVSLVDDVMTTGATLHSAAYALLEAGVSRVDAWVCARTP